MKDTLNVLIRTSDRPNSFLRALQSLLIQGIPNLKVIVSVDNKRTLEYVRNTPGVDVIVENEKKERSGPGHAPYNLYMNSLLGKVEDGWVYFLDDDNYFLPGRPLRDIFNKDLDPSRVYLFKSQFLHNKRVVPDEKWWGKKIIENDLDTSNFLVHSSIAKKYEWEDKTGGDFKYLDKIQRGIGTDRFVWLDSKVACVPQANLGKNVDIDDPARTCNVCGYRGSYLNMGLRKGARCPHCGSFERHRVLWKLLEESTGYKSILSIAPEEGFVKKLSNKLGKKVQSSEYPKKAGYDYCLDLNKTINLEDGLFDLILCSHVLEHLRNDKLAVKELYRILKPGGTLILMFPVRKGKTYQDEDKVNTPDLRRQHYGQHDHLRFYGLDSMPELFKNVPYRVVNPFLEFDENLIKNSINCTVHDFAFVVNKPGE